MCAKVLNKHSCHLESSLRRMPLEIELLLLLHGNMGQILRPQKIKRTYMSKEDKITIAIFLVKQSLL